MRRAKAGSRQRDALAGFATTRCRPATHQVDRGRIRPFFGAKERDGLVDMDRDCLVDAQLLADRKQGTDVVEETKRWA